MDYHFFIDVSGRDHGQLPYEVRVALGIDSELLPEVIEKIEEAERLCFMQPLRELGVRIKGSRLLQQTCYQWAREAYGIESPALARSFITEQGERRAWDMEFTSYGTSCLEFVDRALFELKRNRAHLVAVVVPRGAVGPESVRADYTALLERMELVADSGTTVAGEWMPENDSHFHRHLLSETSGSIERSPFFAKGSLATLIGIADVLAYAINVGYRRPEIGLNAAVRSEVQESLSDRIDGLLRWQTASDEVDGLVYLPSLPE